MKGRKALLVIGLFTLLLPISRGQQQYDFFLRNYKQSLVFSINHQELHKICLSAYGNREFIGSSNITNKYLFQAQEYDQELGIYHFPYRLYAVKEARFMSPDPKSQYYSPYLFVSGDPINHVDNDGKEGKPLVLYQEDGFEAERMSGSTMDLKTQIPDAHYMPISDFLNEVPADLPEWNGNVFIKAHMGEMPGAEIGAEEVRSVADIRSPRNMVDILPAQRSRMAIVTVDGKKLGKSLAKFSKVRKVPLKNVVAGGCQGSVAAKAIKKGVASELSAEERAGTRFMGLRRGYLSLWAGPKKTSGFKKTKGLENMEGLDDINFFVVPNGQEAIPHLEEREGGRLKMTGYDMEVGDEMLPLQQAPRPQARRLLDGDIPRNIRAYYEVY